MPAARGYLLSVAPVPMVGITATLGPKTSRVTFSIGPMTSGVSGDGEACSIAGPRDTLADAFASPGLATMARIAAPISGVSIAAVLLKYALVTSLSMTGN